MRWLWHFTLAASAWGFIPNRGQWDASVAFGEGGVAFHERGFRAGITRLEFAGARTARLEGEQAGARVNYLTAGLVDLPAFARLRYRQAYPGIDIVFYRNAAGELEFDFELAPGADIASIRLALNFPALLDTHGALTWGSLKLRAPVAVQAGQRKTARFVRAGADWSIAVERADWRRPLVIDPVVEASTFLGGSGGGSGESIAIGADGSIYVAGTTNSNNQPVKDAMQELFLGSYDMFITKFDPTGRDLIYSTYLGTWADDRAIDIAVDAAGHAYVAGYTNSADLPVVNAAQGAYAGGSVVNGGDAYVFKLNPEGNALVYATYLGGLLDDYGRSIAVDAAGRAWISGSTMSQDFPLASPLQDAPRGGREGFLARLSADGAQVEFSTYLGGSLFDEVYQIALAPDGTVSGVGSTQSTDFPVVRALRENYGGGARDAFVFHLNQDATEYLFATYLGGALEDQGRGIDVDSDGAIYVTGFAGNGTFPTANAFQTTFRGGSRDIFLTKLPPDGVAFVYSTFIGGGSTDEGFGVAVTRQKEPVVAGFTQSLNFQTSRPIQAGIGTTTCRTTPCTADVALAKFSAAGRPLLHSTYFGGTGADQPRAVAITPSGAACFTGFTGSANLPLANPFQDRNFGGGANVPFVSCIRDE